MHTTRGAALLAAAALTVSGLAACGDEGEPTKSSSTASPSAVGDDSSSESSGSESSSSSSSGSPRGSANLPKDFPAAAEEKTEEGAAAFGKYYLDKFGDASKTGNTQTLKLLGTKTCSICNEGVQEIASSTKKGWTLNKNPYTPSNVKATKRPDSGYKVAMHVEVATHKRLDSSGESIGTSKSTEQALTQHVIWADGRWQMSDWVVT